MKFLSMRYRETQRQHFAKRGISWHGAALLVNRCATNGMFQGDSEVDVVGEGLHEFQLYYLHDILIGNDVQNTPTALGIVDTVIMRVKKMFPNTATVSVQSVCAP